MEGARTPEERRAAAEARGRVRAGEPPQTGDEELLGAGGQRGASGRISRHYGGEDIYRRRRLLAGAAVVVVILLILVLVAC